MWVFGYGSLIFRPGFPFVSRRVGYVRGLARRFYQGSTDHRGTPDAPGRVVTLVPRSRGRCGGVAYQIDVARAERVLAELDHREKGGYRRLEVQFHPEPAHHPTEAALRGVLVYLAAPDNPNYLGPASLEEIARQIQRSRGPSGHNRDYLLQLARSLRRLGLHDPHVFALERLVRRPSRHSGRRSRPL